MRRPFLDVDGAAGRDQRLADHLAAEHPLPGHLRRAPAEQVHLELFEVEDVEEGLDGGHEAIRRWRRFAMQAIAGCPGPRLCGESASFPYVCAIGASIRPIVRRHCLATDRALLVSRTRIVATGRPIALPSSRTTCPAYSTAFTFFNELDVLEIRLAELDPLGRPLRDRRGHPHTHGQAQAALFRRKPASATSATPTRSSMSSSTICRLTRRRHWARESYQREAIMRGLADAAPDDRIIISDCDEIPKPDLLRQALAFRGLSHRIVAFWCDNYFYRLNLRNDAHDHRLGPRLLTMGNLKSPNAVREIQFRFSKRALHAAGRGAVRQLSRVPPHGNVAFGRRSSGMARGISPISAMSPPSI